MPDVISNDRLLHASADALRRLLSCPALNLDELELETRAAITHAELVLEALHRQGAIE
jgi:hypothetical protein